MVLLLFYLFLALTVSFLCSILEATLLSTPVSFLRLKQEEGVASVRHMLWVKDHLDNSLSGILTLNTIAHTVGAAGVGAQAAVLFGSQYVGWASAVMTVLVLVFTEIIPKSIGAIYWRKLTVPAGSVIRVMFVLTFPIVVIASWITRLFRSEEEAASTSREEVSALMGLATEEGVIDESENRVVQNVLRLKDIRAEEVMTPRVVVTMAEEESTLGDIVRDESFRRFSRIPVYADNPDNVTGYIFMQTVFELIAQGRAQSKLKEIRREIVAASETWPVFNIWNMMLKEKEHIALVVDDYGGMAGIVTMEDIVETLLGVEIVDEKDLAIDMQQLARDRWRQRQKRYGRYYAEQDADAGGGPPDAAP